MIGNVQNQATATVAAELSGMAANPRETPARRKDWQINNCQDMLPQPSVIPSHSHVPSLIP